MPTRLHCCYWWRCCFCCYCHCCCCCCFCNLIMHLIKEMKFLLRLFAYSLAGSSRRFYVYPARVWVCVYMCVCACGCIAILLPVPFCLPYSTLFSHVPPAEPPPSSTFLFSHNFFECGWISAILRCDRPGPDAPQRWAKPVVPAWEWSLVSGQLLELCT